MFNLLMTEQDFTTLFNIETVMKNSADCLTLKEGLGLHLIHRLYIANKHLNGLIREAFKS